MNIFLEEFYMKVILKIFKYIPHFFSNLKGLAYAVNVASTSEELDELVLGGKK